VAAPTITRFDHITNVGALGVACEGPGIGFFIDTYEGVAPDSHTVTNAIFWGNGPGQDFAVGCGSGCKQLKGSVDHSMVDTKYGDGSIKVTFGAGNIAPADPRFVAPDKGDFRLQSDSPAVGKASDGSNLGADGVEVTSDGGEEPSAPAASKEAAPAKKAKARADSPPEAAESEDKAPPAAPADVSAKEAFEAAKELGTVEAWEAFIASYPEGFHAKLARAYIKKLGGG